MKNRKTLAVSGATDTASRAWALAELGGIDFSIVDASAPRPDPEPTYYKDPWWVHNRKQRRAHRSKQRKRRLS